MSVPSLPRAPESWVTEREREREREIKERVVSFFNHVKH
jgi:hypothetical protein